jgi:hypothetical protein
MTNFIAIIQNGKLTFKNDFMREKFVKFVKFHEGKRVFITPTFKESDKQRGFYEGAVVPMVTFFQEGMDYRNSEDNRNIRETLKIEFNGAFVQFNGKSHKIGKSTQGKLNDGFIEAIIDWLEENYGIDRTVVLNTKWRDEVYPFGGPDDYITYLKELNLLK